MGRWVTARGSLPRNARAPSLSTPRQPSDEEPDVGDHSDALEASTIHEFRNSCLAYVHAHQWDRRGQAIARGDSVEHRPGHDAHSDKVVVALAPDDLSQAALHLR